MNVEFMNKKINGVPEFKQGDVISWGRNAESVRIIIKLKNGYFATLDPNDGETVCEYKKLNELREQYTYNEYPTLRISRIETLILKEVL